MIGKIIKTMRRESGLSQQDLADRVYIGRTTLSDYERMKTDINFENIEKIANTCGFEVIFRSKKNKNHILTSDNIKREEI